VVWGLARQLGGRVLLRLETHDRGRCRPEYSAAILEDLAWLGFEPDDGPADQSEPEPYDTALETLRAAGLVYACACSRREWAVAAVGASRYTGRCRDLRLDDQPGRALRLRVDSGLETFRDGEGVLATQDAATGGDIILRDRDGCWSYHLAVCVDDLRQGIDLVVRGEDLLEATGVQVRLARWLGRPAPPVFVHHGLVRGRDGRKLSKSNHDTGVRDLRTGGASPAEVIGLAAWRAGLARTDAPCDGRDVGQLFEPSAAGGDNTGSRVLG